MQRSSERVGALAAALAKAQSEIANPEKSLTATIVSPFPREGMRRFRYAPLSAGLDLVRKCLGQHEIATVQTTAIDQGSSLITLTTTLVHASGEWVSSEWPVCPVSETAAPHRLGAALTYARRYALFTLVGIAGEDDLDAPDVAVPVPSDPQINSLAYEGGAAGTTQTEHAPSRPAQVAARRARTERSKPIVLTTKASKDLTDRLKSELAQLKGPEALASWAQGVLPLKNQLSQVDAETIEAAFTAKLGELGDALSIEASEQPLVNGHDGQPASADPNTDPVVGIPKPVRERDRNHLRFVATQPCLLCARTPSDAHHIKFAELTAMGRKVSDRFTVPICRLHHRELHHRGNERLWWQDQAIDPLPIAAALWARTHEKPSGSGHVVPATDTAPNTKHSWKGLAWSDHHNDETKPIRRPEAR
jgi:ERF superfamily